MARWEDLSDSEGFIPLTGREAWTPLSFAVVRSVGALTAEVIVGVLIGDGIAGSELSLSTNPSGICHSSVSEDMILLASGSGGEFPGARTLFCSSSGCSSKINRFSISLSTILFFHEASNVSEPSASLPIEAK